MDNGLVDSDSENDLEDIGKMTSEIINIDARYQPQWGPSEGFRENYQNWYDIVVGTNYNADNIAGKMPSCVPSRSLNATSKSKRSTA